MKDRWESLDLLIEKLRADDLSEAEQRELTDLLEGDDAAQTRFAEHLALSAALKERPLVEQKTELVPFPQAPRRYRWVDLAAAAVVLLSVVVVWRAPKPPEIVATLVSSEHAAWESALPTTPGSNLTAGRLSLKAGVATIRFASGAEVMIEAPAELELETPMRGRLLAGSAVIDVPEPAIGFVMATPDGYAVDHGTQFAVSVDEAGKKSEFQVLSGEISVHLPQTGQELRLSEDQAATIRDAALSQSADGLLEAQIEQADFDLVRLSANRGTSVIANDKRDLYLHPDLLMAKRTSVLMGYNRRALFSFDLAEVDLAAIASARIRMNLVPSGLGYAAHLPEDNRFALYGLVDESAEGWSADALSWEEAPDPERVGVRLGEFTIPRGVPSGSFGIETTALLEFLKEDQTGQVTLILVRETDERLGDGLVHTFANIGHPEASGPVLELILR
jgi:ferric-dicitrate binding protein FerR (iron transport regulator)